MPRPLVLTLLAAVAAALAACAAQPSGVGPVLSASPGGSFSPASSTVPSLVPSGTDAEDLLRLRDAITRTATNLGTYWAAAYPATYGGTYRPISKLIAYHSVADAPVCNGERLRLGNAYYCSADDSIAWDEPGLMLSFYREAGDFAVAFVLAHEWGHAVAARAGANLPLNVFGELQADCFAGAYAAWADQNGLLDKGDLDEAVYALYSVRDPAGTPWLDPAAHGSALDRIRSFSAGMDSGAATCANYSLPEPSGVPPEPSGLPPPS